MGGFNLLISRELDYAVRIIRALSNYDLLTVKQICDAEYVPQPYAYKILKKMEKSSIVEGVRGTTGGYQLIASLDDFNLYDVYSAIEGNLYVNACMQPEYACPNNSGGKKCNVHLGLIDIQNQIIDVLQRHSMAEILNAPHANKMLENIVR